MKRLLLILWLGFCCLTLHAAYLRNIPMTLTQPDGTTLYCFASGDEYFNYLHDKNGYTIMRHPQTGYYVYAEKRDGKLVATNLVAGRHDPSSKGLQPYALISPDEWMARRKAWKEPEKQRQHRDYIPNHGTLNNLVIFIRFSDDEPLTNSYSAIDNMFNDVSDGAISMRSYFRAASYGAIEIPTTFYPGHNGEDIISYQDTYPRSYFEPYDEYSNLNGYQDSNRAEREFSLLERAVRYVNANYPIPSDLNIDYDEDGYVDNICFIVKGTVGEWNSLLWPHKWALYDRTVLINGKQVWTFNFQLADASGYFNTSTMCHEMNHSLSAPDLYHYSYSGPTAVGIWDLMENNATPPQHCGAYMKMKYGHWIDEIPEITEPGVYTLNPISSASPDNVAYKIATADPDQFYVLEYRDNTSLFETALPGSGLLIYRIDTRFSGNADYNPSIGYFDEVYVFRPDGSVSQNGNLNDAYFSSDVGRTDFNFSTEAYPFLTDGTLDYDFAIYDITSAGNTISFRYGASGDCEAPTNLVATLEGDNVLLSWDAAANAVSYNIYRDGHQIDNTTETSYIDSGLPYGRYTYFLKSVDANGLFSLTSESVIVTYLPEGAVIIGDGGSASSDYLPSYSYYNYSLTQQIYTPDEIGPAGIITSMAFYNEGAKKTRTYDFYLNHTGRSDFTGNSDWEPVSPSDKVFSGTVNMTGGLWTVIEFDTPFVYDGISNLVLTTDDNTGSWSNSPHLSCRVFNAPSQTLRIYSDGVDYDPFNPKNYEGVVMMAKNQLLLQVDHCAQDPENVHVTNPGPDEVTVSWTSDNDWFELRYYENTSTQGFENGIPEGWITIDADGDGYNWGMMNTMYNNATGHESSNCVASQSYANVGLHPDNYLVMPLVELGDVFSFWACAYNHAYAAEHFGVAVSTGSQTNVADFVTVKEWTMTAKDRALGAWYEYSVDLSDYAGQTGYIAIRHFNCYDQYALLVDDVHYGMSENAVVITDINDTSYLLNGLEPAKEYYVEVRSSCGDGINFSNWVGTSFINTYYSVTVSADPEEGGNVTGSGVYFKNEQVALSAEPAEGYTFLYWTKDGEYVSALSPYSFISNENVEYVAHFEPIDGRYIGDGSANLTNEWVPSYSYYKYSLTQQIYTADEIGEEGSISSLSFFNGGETKTRNFDIYLVPTSKVCFENNLDWISTTEDDRVFSGEVSLTKGAWTEIVFDTPFDYDGVSNLALIVDDNTGNWSNAPHLSCRVFNTNGTQALRVYSDNDDFDPLNPVNQTGTLLTVKNQIILHQSGHVAHLVPGWNWYSSYMEYHDGSLEAIENCIAATSSTAMIKSQGGGFANLNNHIWTGVLRDLSNKQMYLIMVGEEADVTLQGGKVNPANCPITLFNGWNWISCLLDKETSIADALVNLTPVNGDMIKGQESNSTFLDGQWRGTLQSLKPGQGYIYLRNGSTVTFTYPSTVTPQR